MKIMWNSNFGLSKILLQHSHAHSLLFMAAFMLTVAEWSSSDRHLYCPQSLKYLLFGAL